MYPYTPSRADIEHGVEPSRNAGARLPDFELEPREPKVQGPQVGDVLNVGTLAGQTEYVPEAPWTLTESYRLGSYLGVQGHWTIRVYILGPANS